MPAPDPQDLLERDFAIAEAAVREAGTLAHGYFFAHADSWEKEDSSPVSEADHAVDRLLNDRLLAHRPDYGWISEETADDLSRLERERVWIVDPIDGTRAFIKHRPHWVISVALAIAGKPVFGFLFNPILGEFFAAMRGRGATLNGRPISASTRGQLAGCRMLASAYRLAPERWPHPWPEMDLTRYNSFAYQAALVACDRADATIAFARIHQWDLAAADIILSEAGGMMTTPDASPILYNTENLRYPGAVIAGPALH
ncbi:MAG: 3'(2'),5'-bisphosphate nucleotidase CysQ, partial [Rhizobiales bacterium]|nr:3'(2'),5'-bisphosphate nucleotidase CysQ [Hyphomicrobiales bacterium]